MRFFLRANIQIIIVLLLLFGLNVQLKSQVLGVKLPEIVLTDLKMPVAVELDDSLRQALPDTAILYVSINGSAYETTFIRGKGVVEPVFRTKSPLVISVGSRIWKGYVNPIPIWMSVLPSLVAIVLAFVLKEVFTALFAGILVGTSVIAFFQGNSLFLAIGKGVLMVVDTYVVSSLFDRGHLSIIVFSMAIGGMVQLISANGGMQGVVDRLSRLAHSPRSGQFVAWLLGVIIFFDDYANTLVVGNTMQPVVDRLKISRAKLAYIVDSTAAPVAAIAFVTTWIGAELSYIQDGIDKIGLGMSAYQVFINSLAYSFYPILTLIFILLLIGQNRDFGPMLKAERLSRQGLGEAERLVSKTDKSHLKDYQTSGKRPKAFNAIVPVLVIIFGTLGGLLYTGWNTAVWNNADLSFATRISETIGAGDSYKALLWSSISGLAVALLLTVSQKLLRIHEAMENVTEGFRVMLTAIIILTLAWSVALVTEHLHTADFISALMLRLSFSPYLIPALTFILGALVAFSTGTSWGTMAILYPLLLPSSWLLTQQAGLEHSQSLTIFYSVVSAVLSGAIVGDHASPISDTTILSSISSGCNHIHHVETQMPYALTVAGISVVVGIIPSSFGVPSWIVMLLSVGVMWLVIRVLGKSPDITPAVSESENR